MNRYKIARFAVPPMSRALPYLNQLPWVRAAPGCSPFSGLGSAVGSSVAPKGAKTEVVLNLPDENWEHYRQMVGKSQALAFNVTDMKALHADLKAKGVKF